MSTQNFIAFTLFQQHTNGAAGPLRCETANIYTIACQLIALKLMKWLSDLTEESGKKNW